MPPPHHPRWKARVPRDNGAGWDFEDVRDHYLRGAVRRRPGELRSAGRRALLRALPRRERRGHVAAPIAEWRSPASGCGGALVWFFRDLWPGAGWGIIDSTGDRKAALWYLKRAWAPVSVHLVDEGLDGYAIHAINETSEPLEALVEFEMYKDGRSAAAAAQATITVPARGAVCSKADSLLGYFSDATNAYRFGPAKYDAVTARLMRADSGEVLSEDFRFPTGLDLPLQRDVEVSSHAARRNDGTIEVTLRSDVFLQSVAVSCEGFSPSDNYFHLAPNQDKQIVFRGSGELRATIEALNTAGPVVISCPDSPRKA